MNKYTQILIDKIFTKEIPADELAKLSKANLDAIEKETQNRKLPPGNQECLDSIKQKRKNKAIIISLITIAAISITLATVFMIVVNGRKPDITSQIDSTKNLTSKYVEAKDDLNIKAEQLAAQTDVAQLGKLNTEGAKDVLINKKDEKYNDAKNQTEKMSQVSFDEYNTSYNLVKTSLNDMNEGTKQNNYLSRAIILQYKHNESLKQTNFGPKAQARIFEVSNKYQTTYEFFTKQKLNEYTNSIKELNKSFDNVAKNFVGKDKIDESADDDIAEFAKYTGKDKSEFISDTQYNIGNILNAYQEKVNEYLKKIPNQQILIIKDEIFGLDIKSFKENATQILNIYIEINKD
jgi:hypothetical protein